MTPWTLTGETRGGEAPGRSSSAKADTLDTGAPRSGDRAQASDEDAYMALALCNAQGELHPLEEGLHALGSGLDQKAYAEKIGKARTTLQHRWHAAEVLSVVPDVGHDQAKNSWRAIAELFSAPRWLWKPFVSRLVGEGWTWRLPAVRHSLARRGAWRGAACLPSLRDVDQLQPLSRSLRRSLPYSRHETGRRLQEHRIGRQTHS